MPNLSRSSSTAKLSPPHITSNSPSPSPILPPNDGPSSEPAEPDPSEDTKIKQLLTVLKKAIGVKDMGAMRLSLPANLITPIGNLEYWCYLDRPDVFAAMDDAEDEFERMLAVLRWTLTKDSKFVHGPICKPYNSVLGEQFRCIYDVTPIKVDPETGDLVVFETPSRSTSPSGSSPANRARPASLQTSATSACSSAPDEDVLQRESNPSMSTLATTIAKPGGLARVVFLNEQVSHHPPISCFWYEARPKLDGEGCQSKPTVIAHGVDQISAKFTGTSVKVFPSPMNKGIFVELPNRNEEYEITHPTATISGLLRANPYVAITDYTYITCKSSGKRKFRTMISYIDESWVGKARFALEGIIYELQETDDPAEWTKLRQVPAERIWCKFSGSWRGQVTYTMTEYSRSRLNPANGESRTLVDMSNLKPLVKTVKAESKQTEMESRRFWQRLTELIKTKNYGEATKVKQTIEQAQREVAAKRKSANESFQPVMFKIEDEAYLQCSKPNLSTGGVEALEAEFQGIGYQEP